MGAALSSFFSTRPEQPDLRPILFLSSAANDQAARELLKAAIEERHAALLDWGNRLSRVSDSLAAAAATLADKGNPCSGMLHLAAAMGEHGYCVMLMDLAKQDVNGNIYGVTPLMAAVKGRSSLPVIQLLLAKGADPNTHDSYGNMPLHIALEKGNQQVVQQLLAHGADINQRCETDEFPVHIAARRGDIDSLRLLAEYIDINVFNIDAGPRTALIIAASEGHAECISYLLELQADPNIPDLNGKIAIQIAAARGFPGCVFVLFPVTNRLPFYEEWTADEILRREGEEGVFWDAEVHIRVMTTGFQSWNSLSDLLAVIGHHGYITEADRKKAAEEEKEEEKGMASFIHANLDKLAPWLVALSTVALTYSYGTVDKPDGKYVWISNRVYHVLCAGTIMSVSSLTLLYGFGAFYKEAPAPSSKLFQLCAILTWGQNYYLLFLMVIIMAGLERADMWYIAAPAAVMAFIVTITWPCFLGQPHFFIKGLKAKWRQLRRRPQNRAVDLNQVLID